MFTTVIYDCNKIGVLILYGALFSVRVQFLYVLISVRVSLLFL